MSIYRVTTGEIVFTAYSSLHNLVSHNRSVNGTASGEIAAQSVSEISIDVPADRFSSGDRLKDYATRDYLDYKKYPAITFRSHEISLSKIDGSHLRAEIAGTVTIMKTSHSVKLSASIAVEGNRSWGEASFRMLLSDFGLKPPKVLFLSIKNHIDIKVALTLEAV